MKMTFTADLDTYNKIMAIQKEMSEELGERVGISEVLNDAIRKAEEMEEGSEECGVG